MLALDGVFDTGLATVLDAFQTANELAEMSGLASPRFDVTIAGMRKSVKTSQGLTVPVCAAPMRSVPDWVVVPADRIQDARSIGEGSCEIRRERRGQSIARVGEARRMHCGGCIGTFVLAESGLLDDQDSTTTWWLAPLFRQRYPNVRVDESRMIVKSGKFVTAGAALSHMDLALWLIRQKSPKLAALTAKYLVVDSRPSQSAYILVDHFAHSDPLVERFESWARGRLKHGFSLDDAAETAGTSKRTLARRMQAVLGKSPLSYFQELRVERAVHLLKTTDESVDEIAARVGYTMA